MYIVAHTYIHQKSISGSCLTVLKGSAVLSGSIMVTKAWGVLFECVQGVSLYYPPCFTLYQ